MVKAAVAAVEYKLPERLLDNRELAELFPEWAPEKIEEKLGIVERRISAQEETSRDLAEAAARKLFASGSCSPGDVDYVLFCTQSPDYFLPTSSCIMQERLGLPRSCGALDFNLGCSGWVYGLGLAKGLIETGQARNVLFLTGETYSKFLAPADKSTRTLFGDAGTATWIVGVESDLEMIGPFVYGTDGRGAEHLIVKSGGFRQGGDRAACLSMNGGEIFSFTLREVTASVAALLAKVGLEWEAVDLCIFHQANRYMLDALRRKIQIPEDKFYTHFREVGNTVSNTIPIALHHAMREDRLKAGDTVLFSGFGVGLSWASCLAKLAPAAGLKVCAQSSG